MSKDSELTGTCSIIWICFILSLLHLHEEEFCHIHILKAVAPKDVGLVKTFENV